MVRLGRIDGRHRCHLCESINHSFSSTPYTVPTPSPLAHLQVQLAHTIHFRRDRALSTICTAPTPITTTFNLTPQSAPFLAHFPAISLDTHHHRPDLPDPFSSATPPPQLPVLTGIRHCFSERALYEGPLCVVVVMISVVAAQRVVKMICRLPLLYCHDGYPVSMRLPPSDIATH
jgi:hypothetical protein